ncbi:HesA/MoeB/ThiF family protein [Magnetospirillum molischianum]|uniref:Molybdopterin-synthase adenylyltransferase n=1 Tax=Magnetospirillum molischianum DSM 120 TaxID=1150626 RepID=H8FTT2_MAGML|nr:molybdopterin-synthase adenylyltransferase MoeB [Magnetospirillum molischianum]CCG41789.1 putative Molybdopterin biosynthesis protein moeB [Magnetospirillum molischianum DSM 120]
MTFTEEQTHRYARHILLPEIGGTGQARLLSSRVLVVGAGGLGSPLILYLAAAGVGTITVIDDDTVELSNLQRQVLHNMARLGLPKVESAAAAIADLTPDVRLVPVRARLTASNIDALIADHDLVADGSDNFETRFLINDACRRAGRTLVSAAIRRFDGQLSTFRPDGPCYRCLHPEVTTDGDGPTCANAGVLGAVAGTLGTMQATEVIKELLGIGESLSGRLLRYDALKTTVSIARLKRDPACSVCGNHD